MLEPRSLLKRIANLETLAKRLRTRSRKGYLFVPADKDGDATYNPLSSTSWDGDAYAAGGGTINWNTIFGVPTEAKAVAVSLIIRDESVGVTFSMKGSSSGVWYPPVRQFTQVANQYIGATGVVPIISDGTSYYLIGDELDNVYLFVVGWYV